MEAHPHSKLLFTISSAVVIGAGIVSGYFLYQANKTPGPNQSVVAAASPTPTASSTPTAPTPTPTTVKEAAASVNQDVSNLNLSEVQSTLDGLSSSLSVFSE